MTFTYVVTVEIEGLVLDDDTAAQLSGGLADCIGRGASHRIRQEAPHFPAVLTVRPVTEIPPPNENPDPEAERPAL